MLKLRMLLIVILISIICIHASTVRRSLLDNLNSGLKLLGKNDRRPLANRYYYIKKRLQLSGVSSNIADLVSQTFAPGKNVKQNHQRQDAITIGDGASALSDNSFMSGLLKLLGFDGAKIGAAAINGIVFLAQMVRYGANRFMDYMMTRTWDWYVIVDHINNRIKNDTASLGNLLISPEPKDEENFNEQEERQLKEDIDSGNIFNWMLQNERVSDLLTDARDKSLPDKLMSSIKDANENNNADCVLMLFCKMKPFIWGMQKALNDRMNGKDITVAQSTSEEPDKIAIFFQYLPTFEEFKTNSLGCESDYKGCKLF